MKRRERASQLGRRRLTQTPYNYVGALGAGTIVVLFCLILLWHDPLLFWNDDYELSILPVFADVARSWSEGHLPLLSPYSWVCGNLAGEFQYGTFSVFVNAAVVLIWKFPLSFPQQAAALSIAHLFVLGMGGYLLGRGRNLAPPLSMMVALVAALNGWIICWGATDWFGALGAFAWLPWAWWGVERALDPRRSRWRFLWPAPFVYLVVTGGFPYTVLMLMLLVAWLSVKSLSQTRRLSSIFPLALGVALGFGLAAPAWLALIDYLHGSARAAQDAVEHFQWRVPVTALPAFILPSWTVNWADFSSRLMPHTATELAAGLVAPAGLLAGIFSYRKSLVKTIKWDLTLLFLVLVLCMLPTANVFRWSFRWLPLFHLVLALSGAESLRLFVERKTSLGRRPGVVGLMLLLLALVAAWAFGAGGEHFSPFLWVMLGLGVAWALLELFPNRVMQEWLPPVLTFASLLGTYLCIPPNCGVPKYDLSQELTQPAPLDPQRLYLSVYPAPEHTYRVELQPQPIGLTVRPGSTSMWGGIRFINGYSPIRPYGVARKFDSAIHGEISTAKATAYLHQEDGPRYVLDRLGVDGIIVANEISQNPEPASEWQLAVTTDEGRVFHRKGEPFPQIRSVTQISSRFGEQFTIADVSGVVAHRNRLEAEVTVPAGSISAMLTVSRPFFRGYVATIGKRALRVDTYDGLIPIIEVPPGLSGRLTIVYRPWWLVWGGTIAAVSLLALLRSTIAAAVARSRSN